MTEDEIHRLFKKYRNALLSECQYFFACVHINKRLREQHILNPRFFNTASCYWAITIESLFASIVMWGEKLFVKHGKSKEIDLWKFLNFVDRHRNDLFPHPYECRGQIWSVSLGDIERHRQNLDGLEVASVIHRLRDKYYAHFDKAFFGKGNKLWEGLEINFGALEEMGMLAHEILLFYSLAYDGTGFNVKVSNVDDVSKILRLIEGRFEREKDD